MSLESLQIEGIIPMSTKAYKELETVRSAVIAANPAIMELDFGCEIKHPSSALGKGVLIESEENERREAWQIFFPEMNQDLVKSFGSRIRGTSWHKPVTPNYEILGRTIRLADILLAMEDKQVCSRGNLTTLIGKYNLLKDDLTLQSPETIIFLYQLLK